MDSSVTFLWSAALLWTSFSGICLVSVWLERLTSSVFYLSELSGILLPDVCTCEWIGLFIQCFLEPYKGAFFIDGLKRSKCSSAFFRTLMWCSRGFLLLLVDMSVQKLWVDNEDLYVMQDECSNASSSLSVLVFFLPHFVFLAHQYLVKCHFALGWNVFG